MRRILFVVFFLSGLLLLPAAVFAQVKEAPIYADRVIVVFHASGLPNDAAARVSKAGGAVVESFPRVGVLVAKPVGVDSATLVSRLRKDAAILGADYDRVFDLIAPPRVVEEAAPDPESHTGDPFPFPAGLPADWFYTSTAQQWSVKRVGAQGAGVPGGGSGAWDTTLGAGARIAILDTGVNPVHPDVGPNLVFAAALTFNIFSPINCEVPDASNPPFDLPADQNGHGTWTSSLAAGAVGAGTGLVIGVAPQAQILNIKVLRNRPATNAELTALGVPITAFNRCRFRGGSGLFSWVLAGILLANQQGADVISMSLGGFVPRAFPGGAGAAIWAAFNRVTNFVTSNGSVVVAAAGNNGLDLDNLRSFVLLPADSPNVIAVTASTNPNCVENLNAGATCASGADGLAFYSNFGSSLHGLAAPGGSLPAAGAPAATGFVRGACSPGLAGTVNPSSAGYPAAGPPPAGTSWGCFSFSGSSQHAWYVQAVGTSAATPHVAGVAALVKAVDPGLTPSQLRTLLQQTATDIGKPGYDQFFNYGLANAATAVSAASQ